MKRGPKPELPSTKAERGTFRQDRDAARFQIAVPTALPQRPDWLTPSGEAQWLDDVGRATLVREIDSSFFASYCNLMGAIRDAWQSGSSPPMAAIAEARRMAEMIGIAGDKSRIGTADGKNGAENPFARNGGRP